MRHRLGFLELFALTLLFLTTAIPSWSQCTIDLTSVNTALPQPTIDPVDTNTQFITGKAPFPGSVLICVAGVNSATNPQSIGANGTFSAKPATLPLTAGQTVWAQFVPPGGGNPSNAVSVTVAAAKLSCAKSLAAGSPTAITLAVAGDGTYSGTLPSTKDGTIIVCVNDQPPAAGGASAPKVAADSDGDLTFTGTGLKLNSSDTIIAYYLPAGAAAGAQYTNSSQKVTISNLFRPVAPLGMVVAGLDISGASSTDPQAVVLGTGIIDVPVIGPSKHNANGSTDFSYRPTLWFSGLVRIAGMAQPGNLSGNLGDLSSLGTYLGNALNANPDKIVQSIEVGATIAGQIGSWRVDNIGTFDTGTFRQTANRPNPGTLFTLSIIASGGAITPLSASQANPPVYYLTQQIATQYNLTPPTSGCDTVTPPTCYVAFVPTDRTHFYRNYEAGLRLKIYGGDYADSQPQYRFPGMADFTIGQNEYVTGGKLRGLVMHVGGSLPVPTLDGVYIFGQMDLGLNAQNGDRYPQVLLTPVPSTANLTYLSPSVMTVPTSQPNRDRYRFGFGVDIFHLVSAVRTKVTAAPKS
jgi:hypothetical protein